MSTASIQTLTKSTFDDELKGKVLQLWQADREVFGRSQESATALGAALVELKKVTPHGEFKKWLKGNDIDRNRASYCMRVVTGKDAASKSKQKERIKQPKVVDISNGCYVRWDNKTYLVDDVRQKGNELILAIEESAVLTVQQINDALDWIEKRPEDPAPENGIRFSVPELKKRLAQLGAVVARTSQEALYVSVRIFTNAAGIVCLQGVNLDSTLTIKLTEAVTGGAVDALFLGYTRLNSIVQKLQAPEATLMLTSETEALLTSGKSSSRLSYNDPAPFTGLNVVSRIPSEDELVLLGGYKFPLPELKEQIEQVLFAVPKMHSKYVAGSALLEADGKVFNIVGTDGHVMSISYGATELNFTSFTIPKAALELLTRLDGVGIVKIIDDDGFLTFSTDLELLTYGKTHTEFPPYKKIVPAVGCHTSTIVLSDKVALLAALGRLHKSCFGELKTVSFASSSGRPGELRLVATRTDKQATGDTFTDMSAEIISAKTAGVDVNVQLNIDLLLPFVKRAAFPITLYIKDSSSVVDVHENKGTPAQPTYRLLVMPTRWDSSAYSKPLPQPGSEPRK
jgi:DNA polymerase III sliding clamp (beta) subunit (PCNA family)